MTKPRIFISSTCYDLTDARARLTEFLESFGFEVLNSQLKTFGVTPGRHTSQVCLDQVDLADYFILIIGSRSGTLAPDSEKTITNIEYDRARERGLVILPFVKQDVLTARRLFQTNPKADFSTFVESTSIFHFIDQIASAKSDNWLHGFDSVEDIREGLRSQFSYYLLLYARHLGQVGENVFRPVTITGIENGELVTYQVLATKPTPLDPKR